MGMKEWVEKVSGVQCFPNFSPRDEFVYDYADICTFKQLIPPSAEAKILELHDQEGRKKPRRKILSFGIGITFTK